MKKNLIFLVILVFVFLPGFAEVELYQLEKQPVMISIETGHAREGWTPVFLFTGGLELRLWMDGEGNIWPDMRQDKYRQPLFKIDADTGTLLTQGRYYANGKVRFYGQKRQLIILKKGLPIYMNMDEDSGAVWLGFFKPGRQISGYLDDPWPSGDREIHLQGAKIKEENKLLYNSHSKQMVISRESPRIFARQVEVTIKRGMK